MNHRHPFQVERMKRLFLCLVCLFAFIDALTPRPVCATTTAWQEGNGVSVRLLGSFDKINDNNVLFALLDVKLQDGWHVYWSNPGETGTPPSLTWGQSRNIASIDLLYPTPQRLYLLGTETIGYDDHVLFPLRVTQIKGAKEAEIRIGLDLLVCGTMCVPQHFDISLSLREGADRGEQDAAARALVNEALARLPSIEETPHITDLETTAGAKTVQARFDAKDAPQSPDLFIATEHPLTFSKPDVAIAPDGHRITLTSVLQSSLPEGVSLESLPMTLTVVNGKEARALSIHQPETAVAPSATPPSDLPFAVILLLAVLGGFILNLMPCVLPVLSLKILAVLKHAGKEKREVRRSFLTTAAGIVVSFLALAAATIALKATGQTFGWGIQFQQPVFLVLMIALLTIFASNLWGFFTIHPPHFLPHGTGAFADGAFATLLATPCSAPFLGTAVGFALAASSIHILIVFAALGLGMALPYLTLALWPHLSASLPKPGRWMEVLTRLLGFGLIGTAVWLLFVLRAQTGFLPFVVIAAAMTGILFALYLRHKNILRTLVLPAVGLALAGCFAIASLVSVPLALQKNSGAWHPFNEEAITKAIGEGKTVFVDVTADWCLTCKYNKRVVLGQEEVSSRLFGKKDVLALQADWTNPDPAITAFLHRHGSYGIPFNIVFGPCRPQGIALPEILTQDAVLSALAQVQACAIGADKRG